MPNVFISYAHEDSKRKDQVKELLSENDIDVWVDTQDLQPGEYLTNTIFDAIESSRCLLVIYTANTKNADWVDREINHAVERGIPIVLISFGPVEFPETSWLGNQCRISVGLVFFPHKKEELVRAVKKAVNKKQSPVITMLNVKGGVGKTILAANLSGAVHEFQKKSVLLIDFDPQHNLTQLILDESRMAAAFNSGRTVMNMFRGFGDTHDNRNAPPDARQISIVAENCVVPLKEIPQPDGFRIDLVPGSFEIITYFLRGRAADNSSDSRLIGNLRRLIDHFRNIYDLIVIDVNPGASMMTEFALMNSTHVLAPVRPDRFAKHGLTLLDLLLDRFELEPAKLKQLAIMNGVKRGEEDEVERELREKQDFDAKWHRKILDSRIAHSKRLVASPAPPAVSDLTANLAYHGGLGSNAIRTDLRAASEELVSELGMQN
ncbi:MAG: AAA family ATPase [Pseudomonadota bacterium]